MNFGELAAHTDEYIEGHHFGLNRGADVIIGYIDQVPAEMFAGLTKKQKEATRYKLLQYLEGEKLRYIRECETIGLALNEDGEPIDINGNVLQPNDD